MNTKQVNADPVTAPASTYGSMPASYAVMIEARDKRIVGYQKEVFRLKQEREQLVAALRAMMETYSVAHDSQTEARLLEQGNAGAVGRALLANLGSA